MKQEHPLEDFRKFLFVVWKHLNLPEPTKIQYDIAYTLQHGTDRQIIWAFRGIGKSWITSAYVTWRLLMNPKLNILVVSASSIRAKEFTVFTLRLFREMSCLSHLTPDQSQGDRVSALSFDVRGASASHAPSVKAAGITGSLTGSRADLIVPDDVEVLNNSLTQGLRDTLMHKIREFEAILKPGGEIKCLGTPQTQDTVYNVLRSSGFALRIWPSRIPGDEWMERQGGWLAPMLAKMMDEGESEGTPTEPTRFPEEELKKREATYGRSEFALQFMLDVSMSDRDRYPLKLNDLIIASLVSDVGPVKVVWGSGPQQIAACKELPQVGLDGDYLVAPMWIASDQEPMPYEDAILYVDPAGRGPDETSWMVVKQLNAKLYLLDMGNDTRGFDDSVLTAIADCAKEHKVNRILVEANFGDGMFTKLLQPFITRTYPCTIEEVKNYGTSKERRVCDVLEPVMNQHRLVVNRKLIPEDYNSTKTYGSDTSERYQLFYQMSRMTRDKGCLSHDDRIDALAGAVAYYVNIMDQVEEDAIAKAKGERLDAALSDIMEHYGATQKEPTWV